MGPSLHPGVTHPETQCGGRGGASLTHSRAIAAGRCDIAETDPQVHAAGAKVRLIGQGPSRTLPQPQTGQTGRTRPWRLPSASPRIPPHQTKRPLAQLGCSRSMARGRMETSWETWRTGLALENGESRAQET